MYLKIYQCRHNQSAYGPYRATVIWVSGCTIRCRECFNSQLFDGSRGDKRSPLWLLIKVLTGKKLGDRAVVFVGGEPMDQPFPLLISILFLRLIIPSLILTIYSGYSYPALKSLWIKRLALQFADYLIDGPYLSHLALDDHGYRGSANQRVIDLKASRLLDQVTVADWNHLIVIDDKQITASQPLSRDLHLSGPIEECGSIQKEVS